jgi:hypothetical protein
MQATLQLKQKILGAMEATARKLRYLECDLLDVVGQVQPDFTAHNRVPGPSIRWDLGRVILVFENDCDILPLFGDVPLSRGASYAWCILEGIFSW